MAEVNQLLRAARQATPSPSSPGFALSRSELAELVNTAVYRRTGRVAGVDGHYVAKLERGVIRWPGEAYRRAFREVLGVATDSELGFRRPRRGADAEPPLPPSSLSWSGRGNESERERLAWVLAGRGRVDRAVVAYLAEVQVAQRHLEDAVGSARMLPVALAEIDLVEGLARQACGPVRVGLVTLLALYHEFAGRMSDYNGDQCAALYHDDRALAVAREVDDATLAAAAFGLKSHLAWGARDATGTMALAEAGQRDPARLSARVAGFAAQMQGRGHALHRESSAAQRLLDTTHQLTAQAQEHPEDQPWWTYPQTPERVLFQRGVAYLELGWHHAARTLFEQARAALPASYHRDHGRWAASLALACARDGDVTAAVTAGWQAVAIVLDTGSIHTVADLRSMRRALSRQQVDQATLDELDQALHEIIGSPRK